VVDPELETVKIFRLTQQGYGGAMELSKEASAGVCRASRFSRMESPHMPRVSDSAVSKDRSRLTLPFMLPSPYQNKVGTPKW
jgi:hypothetical protein